jgi:hypothetical protein
MNLGLNGIRLNLAQGFGTAGAMAESIMRPRPEWAGDRLR